jgi:hypothetical protein
MTDSFHIIFNSLFINHPIIRRRTIRAIGIIFKYITNKETNICAVSVFCNDGDALSGSTTRSEQMNNYGREVSFEVLKYFQYP